MSAFEIILVIIVVVAAIWGFKSGLVHQLGSLAGIILGVVACRIFGDRAVAFVTSFASTSDKVTLTVIAYVLLFLCVFFAVKLVALLFRKIVSAMQLGLIDRLAGAVFKAFLWLFVVSLVLNVWVSAAPSQAPQGKWAQAVTLLAPTVLGSQTAEEILKTTKGE